MPGYITYTFFGHQQHFYQIKNKLYKVGSEPLNVWTWPDQKSSHNTLAHSWFQALLISADAVSGCWKNTNHAATSAHGVRSGLARASVRELMHVVFIQTCQKEPPHCGPLISLQCCMSRYYVICLLSAACCVVTSSGSSRKACCSRPKASAQQPLSPQPEALPPQKNGSAVVIAHVWMCADKALT